MHPHPLLKMLIKYSILFDFSPRAFVKGEAERTQERKCSSESSGTLICYFYHYCTLDLWLQFPHPGNYGELPTLQHSDFLSFGGRGSILANYVGYTNFRKHSNGL